LPLEQLPLSHGAAPHEQVDGQPVSMHAYTPHATGVLLQVPLLQLFGMKLLPEHCATPLLHALLQHTLFTQLPLVHCTSLVQAWPSARLGRHALPLQKLPAAQLALLHGELAQPQLILQSVAPHEYAPQPVMVGEHVPGVGVAQLWVVCTSAAQLSPMPHAVEQQTPSTQVNPAWHSRWPVGQAMPATFLSTQAPPEQ
jgi:hypothetical protein